MNPIWKDYFVGFGNSQSVKFRILAGNSVIYTGRSEKRPGATGNSIRINDIISDYIEHPFPSTTDGAYTLGGGQAFSTEMEVDEDDWDDIDDAFFLGDWSYDRSFNVASGGNISFPINGRADIRQTLFFSFYLADGVTIHVDNAGVVEDIDYPSAVGTGTLAFKCAEGYTKVTSTTAASYNIVQGCHKYTLHYLNSYGGWDSFLIEGNTKEVDTLARATRAKEYVNRDSVNRSKVNYLNEITKTFTFHTGFLSDDESRRMPNLLNSTDVYMEDLETGTITPVVLTNTSTEYKTYKNTGSLVNYEIMVEVAHNYIRK